MASFILHRHFELSPKAALKVLLVTLAVCEARAGRFRPADTAAIQASVHFRLMKAKHLQRTK